MKRWLSVATLLWAIPLMGLVMGIATGLLTGHLRNYQVYRDWELGRDVRAAVAEKTEPMTIRWGGAEITIHGIIVHRALRLCAEFGSGVRNTTISNVYCRGIWIEDGGDAPEPSFSAGEITIGDTALEYLRVGDVLTLGEPLVVRDITIESRDCWEGEEDCPSWTLDDDSAVYHQGQ